MIYDTLIEKSSNDELLTDCWDIDDEKPLLLDSEIKWIEKYIDRDRFYKALNATDKESVKKLVHRIEKEVCILSSSKEILDGYFRLFVSYELAKVLLHRTDFPLDFISSIVIYSGVKLRKGFSEAGCVLVRGPKRNLFFLNQIQKLLNPIIEFIDSLSIYNMGNPDFSRLLAKHNKWKKELDWILEKIENDKTRLSEEKIVNKSELLRNDFLDQKESVIKVIKESTMNASLSDENLVMLDQSYNHIIQFFESFINEKEQLYLENKSSIHLSWYHLIQSYKIDQNLMVHEFAHVLDYYHSGLNGVGANGLKHRQVWKNNFEVESDNKDVSMIRSYGFTNENEFFAVCSEHFFINREELKNKLPEIHDSLKRIYNYEPPSQEKLSGWELVKLLFLSKVRFSKLPAIVVK